MIIEALAGKRIAITGATGFLGTALVERLLRAVPDCELVLIVRPGRRGAAARVRRDVLRNDAFNRIRRQWQTAHDAAQAADMATGPDAHPDTGTTTDPTTDPAADTTTGFGTPLETFDQMTNRRVRAVAGDVGVDGLGLDSQGREAIANVDIVMHAAATVSFDAALDDAVEVNLLGPMRVAQALNAAGARAHLISVSTCYVAGSRRGAAPEQLVDDSPFYVDVDWRSEVANARQARADAEQRSRRPDRLAKLAATARRELGAAGRPALAAKVESLRRRWVNDTMTKAGRARATSLGFPDAYAYTKALGERALTETRGATAVSFVRPSIIESALAEPHPGWIRGFRMAEPVIAAYARGLLKEFPGVPEGIIDVIPVDLVVSTILAVAARGPAGNQSNPGDLSTEPEVIQVASGSVNPLKYGQLVDLVRGWFTENPVYDDYNQPISVPEWSFPGRGRVSKQLRRAQRTLEAADRVLGTLPLRGRQAEFGANLEEQRNQLQRASGYVELYGAYAECEALYQLDRMLELWNWIDDNDRQAFCFHPEVVDWPRYVREIHLPSMVAQARLKMAPGSRSHESRSTRLRRQVMSPQRQLAVFDLENTLIASNVVASYSWLATRDLDDIDRLRFVIRTLGEVPRLLTLDRQDRSDFLRYFYRRFEGAPVHRIQADCREMLSDLLIRKSFPEGVRRVREHRRAGHKTLLITGALDFVIEPMAPLFDYVITAEMGITGTSATAPGTATAGTDTAGASTAGTGARRAFSRAARHPQAEYDGKLVAVPPTGEARYQALVDFADEHDCDLRESIAYADSTSDLPMLEAVGFPVAVNPETKLAAMARRRGWLIENWATSPGAPGSLLPLAPRKRRNATSHATSRAATRPATTQARTA